MRRLSTKSNNHDLLFLAEKTANSFARICGQNSPERSIGPGWIRHKAGRAALWLSCGDCFEHSASVFAECGAINRINFRFLSFASLKSRSDQSHSVDMLFSQIDAIVQSLNRLLFNVLREMPAAI